MSMLEIKNLSCAPIAEDPVFNVNLTVSEGEVLALCGPNGSGKSTLCRCLAGLINKQEGEIMLDGMPLPSAPWDIARAGLTVVLKGQRVFPELSVEENLLVAGSQKSQIQKILDIFPSLSSHLRQAAGTLSGGEQQMVAIGRGLLRNPAILVLDEPTLGLAPKLAEDLIQSLGLVQKFGCGVILIENDPLLVRGIAARICHFDQGRLVSKNDLKSVRH